MPTKLLYQNGNYWVCSENYGRRNGYAVYQEVLTHSRRVAIVDFEGEIGLKKAISECDKRAYQDDDAALAKIGGAG